MGCALRPTFCVGGARFQLNQLEAGGKVGPQAGHWHLVRLVRNEPKPVSREKCNSVLSPERLLLIQMDHMPLEWGQCCRRRRCCCITPIKRSFVLLPKSLDNQSTALLLLCLSGQQPTCSRREKARSCALQIESKSTGKIWQAPLLAAPWMRWLCSPASDDDDRLGAPSQSWRGRQQRRSITRALRMHCAGRKINSINR